MLLNYTLVPIPAPALDPTDMNYLPFVYRPHRKLKRVSQDSHTRPGWGCPAHKNTHKLLNTVNSLNTDEKIPHFGAFRVRGLKSSDCSSY